MNYDALWLVLYYCNFFPKYHCFLQCTIILFLKVLQSTEISLYFAFTNEWNVAKKEKNIDEWFILLRDIILLRKIQLVTSYSLKIDVNRLYWIPALSNCKHTCLQWPVSIHVYNLTKPVVSFIKNWICQYVNTTDRIIIDHYIAI